MRVLCLNSGSSSLKLALWEVGATERALVRGAVEGIGRERTTLWMRDEATDTHDARDLPAHEHARAAEALFDALEQKHEGALDAVGHRIVHGGPDHLVPTRVDDAVLAALRAATPFAPLHLPAELDTLEAARRKHGGVPHVVCFDTTFHRDMPAVARRLPLPRALEAQGIRRYGFHGLSYASIVDALGDARAGRVIVAHLGSGASLCALRDGASCDTTMGFTPAGGVMMATRSGDLDPGVLVHLMRAHGYGADEVEALIARESGLRGVSGTSADMQALLEARVRDSAADDAVSLFCHLVRKQVGALSAVLGGLDGLVFTGGIGQRAAAIRAEICAPLGYLGIALDPSANEANAQVVSAPGSQCVVRVLPTDEERMIARSAAALLDEACTTKQ
ncbi:MAG: acetate/propionate family kinase [Polyangiales bacterium]